MSGVEWGGDPLRVAVVGVGGVGGYIGSRLLVAGADVRFIARGTHLEALRARGLTVVSPEGRSTVPVTATDNPAEIGPVDVVVFTVKSYDTDSAARRLPPLIGPGTAVLSLQNGIDNEAKIAAAIGWEHVLGGAAYIFAAIRAPGIIAASGPRSIVLAEWAGGDPTPRVRAIVAAAAAGGVEARTAPNIQVVKWEKYVLLAAFSAMSAAVTLPLGDIRRSPAATAMLRDLMTEVWAVGRASGVPLDDGLVERQLDLVLAQDDDSRASLHTDLVSGHRMELDALQGATIRLGVEHGVPTPNMRAMYAILEPWAIRNAAG